MTNNEKSDRIALLRRRIANLERNLPHVERAENKRLAAMARELIRDYEREIQALEA
jgi:hypothetical protein